MEKSQAKYGKIDLESCIFLDRVRLDVGSSNGPPATPERLATPPALNRKTSRAGGGRVARLMFYTYVLKSKKDNKLYIGWTNNLKSRFKKHIEGKVDATKNRLPLELVYYEACLDKDRAIKREKYFKTGFGRRFLKSRI